MKALQNLFLGFGAICTMAFLLFSCSDDGGNTGNNNETTFDTTSISLDIAGDAAEETITIVTITDRGEGIGSVSLSNKIVYVLNGFVYVNSGQTLNVQAGTIIKGNAGQGELASALIVARGGVCNMTGTATDPIIMTSASDGVYRDNTGTYGEGNVLAANVRGLWGGLIVLGAASLNSTPGETQIEGIPTTETRGLYGGSTDDDNSGTYTYISIRHGGTDIGAGNEINGLTMGGVGSGTTIEHIEVIGNKDDGFEWFGGTVNSKWLASIYNGDDAMDYDEGWRGMNQFWLVVQDSEGDRGGEHDGGTDPETATPFATPTVYNATFRGNGTNRAITMRDNAGGYYWNSIFTNYANGIDIELLEARASSSDPSNSSFNQYEDGNLVFRNNVFFGITGDVVAIKTDKSKATQAQIDTAQADIDGVWTATWGNMVEDPMMTAFIPSSTNTTTATSPTGSFYTTAAFKGAFNPSVTTKWTDNWTLADQEGILD